MHLKIAMAQLNVTVGDISGNRDKILAALRHARDDLQADVMMTPELALTGYPPEDLVLRPGFMQRTHERVTDIIGQVQGIDLVLGHPWLDDDGQLYNSASWIRNGKLEGRYDKQCLPNYAIFDEKRYFTPGNHPLIIDVKGCRIAVVICEDCWEKEPISQALRSGAELLLTPNASPYRRGKHQRRLDTLTERMSETGLPMAYCNLVGGQDELLFDGRSLFLSPHSEPLNAAHCQESIVCAEFDQQTKAWHDGIGLRHDQLSFDATTAVGVCADREGDLAEVYQAICLGVGDYLKKNGFSTALLGLSGGIDSALCLAILVDVLGAGQVSAVTMPSRYTSDLSNNLARQQTDLLGVKLSILPIESLHESGVTLLADQFSQPVKELTDQNIQARLRGLLLMAISNQTGAILIATGNKSELATGYCTIYGDMCGGYAPLKDVSKTLAYELARWRNNCAPAIPEAVIDRPPSAELADNQLDEHSLPPYDRLDAIMEFYVEQDLSIHEIVARGFDEKEVRRIAGLVLKNEYKRRQGSPGVRITSRAFGRDRRYPITSGWLESGEDS